MDILVLRDTENGLPTLGARLQDLWRSKIQNVTYIVGRMGGCTEEQDVCMYVVITDRLVGEELSYFYEANTKHRQWLTT